MHRGGDLELGATGHNVAVGEALEHQELEHAVDNTDGLREHMCLMLLFPIRAEPPRLRQNAATCREALGQPQLAVLHAELGDNRVGHAWIDGPVPLFECPVVAPEYRALFTIRREKSAVGLVARCHPRCRDIDRHVLDAVYNALGLKVWAERDETRGCIRCSEAKPGCCVQDKSTRQQLAN